MGFRTDRELKLTESDARIISSLPLKEDPAISPDDMAAIKEYRLGIRRQLGKFYETGDEGLGIAQDPWKAKEFQDLPSEDTRLKTAKVYDALAWFTWFRLLVLRAARFDKITNVPIPQIISGFTTYGGLSYIIEFVVDCGVVFIKSTWPTDEARAATPAWSDRFINLLKKDERPMRMLNAVAWFSVNLACFFVTGGTSAIVNLALFGFDMMVDGYKAYRDDKKHRNVLAKIDGKMAEIRKELNEFHEKEFSQTNSIPQQVFKKKYDELHKYQNIKTQIKESHKSVNNTRLYLLAVTTVIFIGMACFFFPPAGLAGIAGGIIAFKAFGASLALAGSVFGARGRRVYKASKAKLEGMYDYVSEHAADCVRDEPEPEALKPKLEVQPELEPEEESPGLIPDVTPESSPEPSPTHQRIKLPPLTVTTKEPAPAVDAAPERQQMSPSHLTKNSMFRHKTGVVTARPDRRFYAPLPGSSAS